MAKSDEQVIEEFDEAVNTPKLITNLPGRTYRSQLDTLRSGPGICHLRPGDIT